MTILNLRSLALAAVCAASVLGAGAANAEKKPEPQFVVIREHAFIPFGSQVQSWDIVGDRTVLFRTRYNRWYRAETNRVCTSALRQATHIAVIDRGGGSIDSGARIRVDGMNCHFTRLDEIENPRRTLASNY